MTGKLLAVIVILIALASAVPIISHHFMGATISPPVDISTHGAEIDKQLDETMIEAGATCLSVTAGKTLIFDRDEMIDLVRKHGGSSRQAAVFTGMLCSLPYLISPRCCLLPCVFTVQRWAQRGSRQLHGRHSG